MSFAEYAQQIITYDSLGLYRLQLGNLFQLIKYDTFFSGCNVIQPLSVHWPVHCAYLILYKGGLLPSFLWAWVNIGMEIYAQLFRAPHSMDITSLLYCWGIYIICVPLDILDITIYIHLCLCDCAMCVLSSIPPNYLSRRYSIPPFFNVAGTEDFSLTYSS